MDKKSNLEFFDKEPTLRFIHWLGLIVALLGALGTFFGVLGLFADGFPMAVTIAVAGVACLFQSALLFGFEFIVRAAIRYLELHDEKV